jgi:hypothetical protein
VDELVAVVDAELGEDAINVALHRPPEFPDRSDQMSDLETDFGSR